MAYKHSKLGSWFVTRIHQLGLRVRMCSSYDLHTDRQLLTGYTIGSASWAKCSLLLACN